MSNILLISQIVIAILLVLVILIQQEGTGIGAIFGGSEGFYRSKRGVEKLFVYVTILLAFLFLAFSVLQVII